MQAQTCFLDVLTLGEWQGLESFIEGHFRLTISTCVFSGIVRTNFYTK